MRQQAPGHPTPPSKEQESQTQGKQNNNKTGKLFVAGLLCSGSLWLFSLRLYWFCVSLWSFYFCL